VDRGIVLPGGVGTQDEFSEMLAAAQFGFHAKPFGLLNTEEYYDPLLTFIDRSVGEGFMPAAE
jgi:predicted Rossmann-fold nucleotide-binding protein